MDAQHKHSWQQLFIAETIGTFILIFFGLGAVHAAVAFDAQSGIWQIAAVWGVAIMLAIYAVGEISGAHINPAITICLACWDGFDRRLVPTYIAGQLCGAFLAAMLLFALFSGRLAQIEKDYDIQRGKPGSEVTASCYGEFYPSPGLLEEKPYSAEEHAQLKAQVPHGVAFLAEVIGTAILAFAVLALGAAKNEGKPQEKMKPVFVGLTVSLLISVIAPLTQACFNPARDFAPRLFSSMAGWGQVALPLGQDWGWLTVYIVAPILGAIIGGGIYKKLVEPIYRAAN
ncbi:MAG: MIP/aquaporin family protein [Planctomycetota bacterium]